MKKVTLEMIKEARETIKDVIKETPLLESVKMSERTGANVFLKCENLQKTGSFKIRGACNKIANLTNEEKSKGVIASSAGNHAQGVALGAKMNGINATIVMPSTAPLAKVTATKGYGAEVVLEGLVYDDAYAKAIEIQKETGATFLHPFNDEYCGLFLSPIVKAFALTISLTVHTAPWAAHRRRIVVSVAPAIGAKDAPFARVKDRKSVV